MNKTTKKPIGSMSKSTSDRSAPNPTSNLKKSISFALQGGGVHGALTYGIVSRILEEDILVEGAAGTSAGGMNAACIINGLITGGNQGAREMLDSYWDIIGSVGYWSSPTALMPKNLKDYNMAQSPLHTITEEISRKFSPYDLNPTDSNLLKSLVKGYFDFDIINSNKKHKLFLGATDANTGDPKIFSNLKREIDENSLAASACLPTLFKAIEIDGRYYWDGGFITNPPLSPLIYECESEDIILILLRGKVLMNVPTTVREINERVKEITYAASIKKELRGIAFVQQFRRLVTEFLLENGISLDKLQEKCSKDEKFFKVSLRNIRIHVIRAYEVIDDLELVSAVNSDPDLIEMLYNRGYNLGDTWIKAHMRNIGNPEYNDLAWVNEIL